MPFLQLCFGARGYFGESVCWAFYLLFVWHLASVPRGEVPSVAVAQIKEYWVLNHYINELVVVFSCC